MEMKHSYHRAREFPSQQWQVRKVVPNGLQTSERKICLCSGTENNVLYIYYNMLLSLKAELISLVFIYSDPLNIYILVYVFNC